MRFIDFFSGIGGFRVGMERAGHKCVGFCEWDKYATASYTSMHLITDQQREYLATLPLKKRQEEILKEEYRNGEWYANDIRDVRGRDLPLAECWCFGAPCQDFSIAGSRAGLDGDRSSLVREVFRLVREVGEENKPEWLIYENVKGMFSSNKGFDFASILIELDDLGYDCEWQLFNSKDYGVPQNRERIYTIGHSRNKGRSKIFPVEGTNGENSVQVEQIGQCRAKRNNPNQYRVYEQGGIAPTLNCMEGGGREPHTVIPLDISGTEASETDISSTINACDQRKGIKDHQTKTMAAHIVEDVPPFCDLTETQPQTTDTARCLKRRYDAGVTPYGRATNSGVMQPLEVETDTRGGITGKFCSRQRFQGSEV